MVKRSFSLIMAIVLIGCLAFSTLAVDVTSYDFSDSGVQVFAAPQSVAVAPLATAADTASATAGEYGYISNDFGRYDLVKTSDTSASSRVMMLYNSGTYFPSGIYTIKVKPSVMPSSAYMWYGSSQFMPGSASFDGDTVIFSFSVSDAFTASGAFQILLSYATTVDSSSISINSYSAFYYTPVEGISSGYTYSSGAISDRDHAEFDTVSASFGNQPAGDYLINIYHWGQSYDVNFALLYNGRRLSASTDGGVTTAVVSHGGGDLTITGSFDIVRTTNWDVVGGGFSSGTGSIVVDAPGSWTFNISDIVAVPLTNSSVEQYGIFGPVVGFLRNQTSEIKSYFSGLFEKYFGADTTKIDEASSKIEEEQNEIDKATEDFSSAASSASDIVSNDFVVSSDVTGAADGFQSIFYSFFSSLGVFSIFIWLPVLLGVVRVVLKL